MLYSQSPPLADNDADADGSPRAFARDQEARNEPRFGRRAGSAPVYAAAPPRKSIGRRMFRSAARFVILISIGVGATLGWQAYGDIAKQMFAANAPEQAWLLSYLPGTKPAAVAAAASTSLQLEPLAANLDAMRRSFEQLAVRQDQMARSIAALQATNEDIRQKMSSQPPAPAPANAMAAVPPPPKPAAPKLQPAPGAAARPSASAAPVPIVPRSSAQ
jgi:hypothetical protein